MLKTIVNINYKNHVLRNMMLKCMYLVFKRDNVLMNVQVIILLITSVLNH